MFRDRASLARLDELETARRLHKDLGRAFKHLRAAYNRSPMNGTWRV